MISYYQQAIAEVTDRNPRHVEAWMRLEHGTLDQLDAARFQSEALIAAMCVAEAGDTDSEALAVTYGLGAR